MKTVLIRVTRVMHTIVAAILLFGVMTTATWAAGNAASGRLDTSFGNRGLVSTDVGPRSGYDYYLGARGVEIQADGKLLSAGFGAGGIVITRYLANGSLDASFGEGGIAYTHVQVSTIYTFALALQGDGKIVVGGTFADVSPYDFVVARFNADGSPDMGFGAAGKVVTDINASQNTLSDIAIQSDGKILALGVTGSNSTDLALVRYNPDGSLDSSFDADGKVVRDFTQYDFPSALAIQADGRIVAAGMGYTTANYYDFLVARFNADGSTDATFGGSGYVLTNFSGANGEGAYAVAIQGDGKIVAAGSDAFFYRGRAMGATLARYNSDGSLDASFGSGGKVTTSIGPYGGEVNSLVIQADGKIVAGGITSSVEVLTHFKESFNGKLYHGHFDFAVLRYNADGSLDQTFGGDGQTPNGMTFTDFGTGPPELNYVSDDLGYALALQADGKIVLAGSNGGNFGLARYNP